MDKVRTVKYTLALATCFTFFSFNSVAMDTHIENALVEVCKAAQSNSLLKYNKVSKSYRLKDKTVALKVMCNGDDIITFSEKAGAYKTAAKLQRSLGNVNIIDVAKVQKHKVSFKD